MESAIIWKRVSRLAVLTLAASGCAGEIRNERAVKFDTIGAVVWATNSGEGQWAKGGQWEVDPTRATVIGMVDGPEPYVFGQISAVMVGDDDRIYVADGQALEVRQFAPDGQFVNRFGRSGEGPGEFHDISGLGRGPAAGVAVSDGALGRVSVFSADGVLEYSFGLERPYMIMGRSALVRFDDQGRFYDRTSLTRRIGLDTIAIIRYSPIGQVQDTVIAAIFEPQRIFVRRDGVPIMSFSIPFAPEPSITVGPAGHIYVAEGARYSIAQLGSAGDTLLVIQRTVAPAQVSVADRDSALSAITQRYRDAVGAEPRDLPPMPEQYPAIVALCVDEEGYLWVERSSSSPSESEWDIFDSLGRYLGALVLPRMSLMQIGVHSVAGVIYDELGVARVKVMPLDRKGSAQ